MLRAKFRKFIAIVLVGLATTAVFFVHNKVRPKSTKVVHKNQAFPFQASIPPRDSASETINGSIFIEAVEDGTEIRGHFEPPITQDVYPVSFLSCESVKPLKNKLKREKEALNAFKAKLAQWNSPTFPYKPGTKGYVITCRLDTPCLSNLLYLVNSSKTLPPIELWMTKQELDLANHDMLLMLLSTYVTVKVFDEHVDQYNKLFGPLEEILCN